MAREEPLSVLLSQALVAFTIEFDNEFEHRLASTWARPFLTSMVMWSNFMRYVDEAGTPVGDVAGASRIPTNAVASVVGGMERWGYVTVDHDPADGVPPQRKGFGSTRGVKVDTVLYPSMVGKLAKDLWEPLTEEIEARWSSRLSDGRVDDLRGALATLHIEAAMPRYLPIVGGGGLFTVIEDDDGHPGSDRDLPTLLSRALLAFTLDHEQGAEVSLPIAANVLRVLGEEAVRVKDLPLMAGVSKEAVSVSMTWLEKNGYITVEPDPDARGKIVSTTAEGAHAQATHGRRLSEVEADREQRFDLGTLREVLASILDEPGGEDGPLSSGLVPHPGGWRGKGRYKPLTAAFIEAPRDALPRHPMILHRGGWPDGS